MTIHRDLANTELHEPFGMSPLTAGAADIGKVGVSKGDGTSEVRKLLIAEITGGFAKPTRLVVINAKSDFPTPAGGTITLAASTAYLIGSSVNIGTDTLTMGATTAVIGLGHIVSELIYTGTAAMFNATASHVVDGLLLSAVNGRYFSFIESATAFINYNDLLLGTNKGIGTFVGGSDSLLLVESVYGSGLVTGDGISLSSTWGLVQFNDGSITQGAGTALDLGTAVVQPMNLQGLSIDLFDAASIGIDGLANSGNVAVDGLAKVSNCFFSNVGGGTLLNNVTQADDRWRFFNTTLIRDTRPDALASFTGGVTETVIATQSVPVEVNATYTVDVNNQFTVTTDGRFTFDGSPDIRVPIDVRLTGIMASGAAKNLLAFIAINGTVVTNSAAPFIPSSSQAATANVIWQETFTTGDFIEVFVSNEDDTVNFIAQSAVIRVN